LVDGSAEVEFLDDVHETEVEVVHDDLGELLVGGSLQMRLVGSTVAEE
jgi:hypothetical protein